MLDIDNPKFRAGLEKLMEISNGRAAARAQGGVMGKLKGAALGIAGAATFLRLYMLPARSNTLPNEVRLAPAW